MKQNKRISGGTKKMTDKKIVGVKGETIASNFLKRKGFEIIERNYLKKCGEIDIVAKLKNEETLHFVEVKTVIRETHVQKRVDTFRPEENVHTRKRQRLKRTIAYFLAEHFGKREVSWQFDVLVVYLDSFEKSAKAVFMKNIIL
ncbi:MAG: YraN family protein [Candidatus Pacebacteria bacterium]|nr:YraN family protein [Candidatus Paceibacterota bacterium]